MKKVKILYWITTGLFALMMAMSGFMMLTSPEMKGTFGHLGFTSDAFRLELGIAKLIGVVLLVLPAVKGRLKEWIYAGFTINLVSAFVAHLGANDPVANLVGPLLALALLLTSYFSYHKLNSTK